MALARLPKGEVFEETLPMWAAARGSEACLDVLMAWGAGLEQIEHGGVFDALMEKKRGVVQPTKALVDSLKEGKQLRESLRGEIDIKPEKTSKKRL